MKKLLCFVLALILCFFALPGCGKGNSGDFNNQTEKSSVESTASTTNGGISTEDASSSGSAQQSNAYSIVGDWKMTSVINGDSRESIFSFEGDENNGTVSNGLNYEGNYSVSGGFAVSPLSGDMVYKGWFEQENLIKGNIVSKSTGSTKGTFEAQRENSLPYDIRGEWRLVVTLSNGNVNSYPVLFGSGPSNEVSSTMRNGYCRISEKTYYSYTVDGEFADWSFSSAANQIKFSGKFTDNNIFTGEYFEFNKLTGTFVMEREKK